MDLHRRINLKELKTEPERFDFLAGVFKKVIRIDEVHPSDDNDAHYIFLMWVNPDETDLVERAIRKNLVTTGAEGWHWKILPNTGDGLIILSTWL